LLHFKGEVRYWEGMKKLYLTLIFSTVLVGCSSTRPWPSVKRWGYQLQNYKNTTDLKRIEDSGESLWVIDYSRDGSQKNSFNHLEINKLKKNKNTILSYISIGEAEDYRYYFDKLPKEVLVKENKNWKGNFKIKYWDPSWKKILLGERGYFSRLISAGFDGAYLDIVDGFHAFEDKRKAADEMVELIHEISEFTRQRKKNFLLVMQNGADILNYTSKSSKLFKAIDALAVEDYLFEKGRYVENKWLYELIKIYQKNKKFVLSIEYILDKKDLEKYASVAKEKGLLPLVGHRPLKGRLIFSDQLFHMANPCD